MIGGTIRLGGWRGAGNRGEIDEKLGTEYGLGPRIDGESRRIAEESRRIDEESRGIDEGCRAREHGCVESGPGAGRGRLGDASAAEARASRHCVSRTGGVQKLQHILPVGRRRAQRADHLVASPLANAQTSEGRQKAHKGGAALTMTVGYGEPRTGVMFLVVAKCAYYSTLCIYILLNL